MFLLPGVLHCGGGAGPDNADWAAAIDGWVESGKAPERMIAQKGTGAAVTRTRPLCAYPQHAVYSGTGSTDQAENFVCKPSDAEPRRTRCLLDGEEADHPSAGD